MNIILLVPNVVKRYIDNFPETTNNAYDYFNYDNRVVEERVPRGDSQCPYKGPQDLTDDDYAGLVNAAKSIIDPTIARYSPAVACEDALTAAIGSYSNGMFASKVDASKYNALLCSLRDDLGLPTSNEINYRHSSDQNVEAKAKQKSDDKNTKVLHQRVLRELGLKNKDIPRTNRKMHKNVPFITVEKGKAVIKK